MLKMIDKLIMSSDELFYYIKSDYKDFGIKEVFRMLIPSIKEAFHLY